MYEQFTDAVRQCMVSAQREARRLGQEHIGSLHILIAILDTEPAMLDTPGVDVSLLRETAAELVAAGPGAGAKQAIENALMHAAKYKSVAVDIPHILLGILTASDESVTRLFDRTDVNLDAIRNHLREHL